MISAIVLTKNEEKNISDCLSGLSWCDEVLVIDDESTDKTVELARKKGAKVYSRPLKNDFAKQRNFGLDEARGDWVLFVDADERISSPLWYEIMQYTNSAENKYFGFYIKRIDTMWGKKVLFGETRNLSILRLAKKDAGRWTGLVHEVWRVRGKTKQLQNPLNHFPHQTVAEFLTEVNFYSDLRARELYKKKVRVSGVGIVIYPLAKFLLNYLLRLGFLDGIAGLVFALMMSFHSFLVRGKLWLLYDK